MLTIADKESRYSDTTRSRVAKRTASFVLKGGKQEDIHRLELFCPHAAIVDSIDSFVPKCAEGLVVDITSLPKRFFFPVMKRLLRPENRQRVKDIVVTYAVPLRYPPGALAENFNDWEHLPLFSGRYSPEPSKMLVVGVGFQALGLPEHLKGATGLAVKLLLPFPAALPALMRSLELLRQLNRYVASDLFEVYRAEALDPSDTFDRLVTLSRNGLTNVSLAPFGPKPMSLGMCMFAALQESEVFYTQPSIYRPDYSIGVSRVNRSVLVYGYCIRIRGQDLYTIS